MTITPERVRNQEFPIRLKGYDPEEVRRFLSEVAVAYRATIRDGGAEWALAHVSEDMADVLRAAHEAAEKVLAAAEAEAAEIRALAEEQAASIVEEADREAAGAVDVLRRTQARADTVAADCHAAQLVLHDAETRAESIIQDAQAEAASIRADADDLRRQLAEADEQRTIAAQSYEEAQAAARSRRAEAHAEADGLRRDAETEAAEIRRDAAEDREAARLLLERTQALTDRIRQEVAEQAEERAAVISRRAEREARDRLEHIQWEAEEISATAADEARARVEAVLSEGQRRVEALEHTERLVQGRILSAQQEFEEIVDRLVAPVGTTIDLTQCEPRVIFEATEDRPGGKDEGDGDVVRRMVSAAVGRAVRHSVGS